MEYYNILGIKESASPEQIKKAYKKLAMKHHPDRGGDTEMFNKIKVAYETLIDPKEKTRYDNKYNHSNFKKYDFRKSSFSGFASTQSNSQNFYGLREKEINANVYVDYTITLEQAFAGGLHTVEFPINGDIDKVQVDLPVCVKNGESFHYPYRGENRFTHQPRGDLYLNIKIKKDDNYWFEGDVLCTKIVVDFFEAIFGAEKTIARPDGKEYSFKIEPGSQAGSKYRFRNQGYKDKDFIVYLVVSTPLIKDPNILEKLHEIENLIKENQKQK